jgi:hypothetical protein
MIVSSLGLLFGSQLENRILLIPYLATEIYGLGSVLNSVLILKEFRNNSTAYTDNPAAVLFGVTILLFMRKMFVSMHKTFLCERRFYA